MSIQDLFSEAWVCVRVFDGEHRELRPAVDESLTAIDCELRPLVRYPGNRARCHSG